VTRHVFPTHTHARSLARSYPYQLCQLSDPCFRGQTHRHRPFSPLFLAARSHQAIQPISQPTRSDQPAIETHSTAHSFSLLSAYNTLLQPSQHSRSAAQPPCSTLQCRAVQDDTVPCSADKRQPNSLARLGSPHSAGDFILTALWEGHTGYPRSQPPFLASNLGPIRCRNDTSHPSKQW
jgi:hypothetical protein